MRKIISRWIKRNLIKIILLVGNRYKILESKVERLWKVIKGYSTPIGTLRDLIDKYSFTWWV